MTGIYETNIQTFIEERKKIHCAMSTPSTNLGAWDDLVWGETPNRYRFTRHSKTNSYSMRNRSEHSITTDQCINEYYLDFLKAYLSFLHYEQAKAINRLLSDCHAFLDLCLIIENKNILISKISQNNLIVFFDHLKESYAHNTCERKASSIINIINFLIEHKMLENRMHCKTPSNI